MLKFKKLLEDVLEEYYPPGKGVAYELFFYITNGPDHAEKMALAYLKNLQGKVKKGQYDDKKVLKGWLNVVNRGAEMYISDYGSDGDKVNDMFSKSERDEVAQSLKDYYADQLDL